MCGIIGFINLDPEKQVKDTELKRMADSIIRRGPDDEGFFINKNVGLGFRRLSIIDLSTGHQPILNEDDSICIIFNGEIYNYQELRKLLIDKHHVFKTQTDTEVILHLYEEFGEDCVNHLRGMFAFAIWNKNTKILFCARDRFGIKPFHFYFDSKKFLFASEIKAILKVESIDKSLCNEAIDCYFTYGYILRDLTIHKEIKQLLPGNSLTLDLSNKHPKLLIKQYWNIEFEPDYSKTEAQWIDELDQTLSETVKLHMVSDVPLGAFLSGGIDSSSVVALMSKHSGKAIKTFSIGFNESKYNELKFAEAVAKKYGTEHFTHIVEPESIDTLLPLLVSSYDSPFADSSAIPTHIVSKFARNYVTVVLSGDGGDELFAGYNHYPQMMKINNINFNSKFLNRLIWGNINKAFPSFIKGKNLLYYLSRDKKDFTAYYSLFNLPERNKILSKEFINTLESSRAEEIKKNLFNLLSGDFLSKVQKLDMITYMVDDILTKVDRVSMHNSLEVRVPILDHVFAELTFKIPNSLKLNGDNKKYIFKESMKKYLPEMILNHKKQGFGVPLEYWFRAELKDYTESKINERNTKLAKYVNIKNLKKLIRDHNKGMRNLSSRIWSVLVFNEWLSQNEI